MSSQSTAENLAPDSGNDLAPIIPINSAHAEAEVVLGESNDNTSTDLLQDELKAINEIEGTITSEKFQASRDHAYKLMDGFVAKGLLTKNEKGRYAKVQGKEEWGNSVIKTFLAILNRLREIKESNPANGNGQKAKPNNDRKADISPKPAAKPVSDRKPDAKPISKLSSPLAVTLDVTPYGKDKGAKTFNSPGEAYDYANKLETYADAFRQRYQGLLTLTIENITRSIDEAIARIEKAKRNKTKGDQIGIREILEPFVEKNIVRPDGPYYRANPEIEKAAELVKIANEKMRAINEREQKAFGEREARRKAYDEVLKSENSFWQTLPDEKGREVVRFAYQIEVSKIPGITIQQITVKKVAPLFGNVELQEGSVYVLGENPYPYLDKAARIIIDEQEQNAQKKGVATLADVMPKDLGDNRTESK